MYPHHPVHKPFPVQGILDAAHRHFILNHFHQQAKSKGKAQNKGCSRAHCHYDSPEAFIEWIYSSTRSHKKKKKRCSHSESKSDSSLDLDLDSDLSFSSDSDSDSEESSDFSFLKYKTKHIHIKQSCFFKSCGKDKEGKDILLLITKLQSLSVHDLAYLIFYSKCQKCFPKITQNLSKPQLVPVVPPLTSVAYQAPPVIIQPSQPQPYQQLQQLHSVPQPAPSSIPASAPTNPKTDFFRDKYSVRAQGCAFCGHLGHCIHACLMAEEYVDTGQVKIINHHLYLSTSELIPNDGHGLGLKAGVDAWLVANPQYSSIATALTWIKQCDPPPHTASFSVKVLLEPVASTGIYIIEADSEADTGSDDKYSNKLFNMFEVFATWKMDNIPQKASAFSTPILAVLPVHTSASVPLMHNAHLSQYRYQTSAEDQFLTKQIMDWILKGKLAQIISAHVLVISPPIRKELAECLHPCCVETGSFEQVSNDSVDSVAMLELAAKREAEFSLPLHEIDILMNNLHTEASILNQGSQIVVIQEDLANKVDAQINTQHTLCMKGTNGSTSRTFSCAKDLEMHIGGVSFTIHAHVVHTAPFRLLLGRPFHNLLLCWLKDHPDHVDVSICGLADPAQLIAVPFHAHQGAQVRFISALTCQVHPSRLTLYGDHQMLCCHSLLSFSDQFTTLRPQGRRYSSFCL